MNPSKKGAIYWPMKNCQTSDGLTTIDSRYIVQAVLGGKKLSGFNLIDTFHGQERFFPTSFNYEISSWKANIYFVDSYVLLFNTKFFMQVGAVYLFKLDFEKNVCKFADGIENGPNNAYFTKFVDAAVDEINFQFAFIGMNRASQIVSLFSFKNEKIEFVKAVNFDYVPAFYSLNSGILSVVEAYGFGEAVHSTLNLLNPNENKRKSTISYKGDKALISKLGATGAMIDKTFYCITDSVTDEMYYYHPLNALPNEHKIVMFDFEAKIHKQINFNMPIRDNKNLLVTEDDVMLIRSSSNAIYRFPMRKPEKLGYLSWFGIRKQALNSNKSKIYEHGLKALPLESELQPFKH